MNEFLSLWTRASKLMRGAADDAMSRHGVRVGQNLVLEVLWETDGLTPGELAERLHVATPTVVKSATRMQASGLLTRRRDPADARLVRLYLTSSAQAVRGAIEAEREALARRATAALTDEEQRALARALRKIIEEFADHEAAHTSSKALHARPRRATANAYAVPGDMEMRMRKTDAIPDERVEVIPGTGAAERAVADLLPIGAPPAVAERARAGVPVWFHTFALAPGIYTPGIARDHRYRPRVLGAERFRGRSVLDVGSFDGFYAFLAEARGARRVVAIDNEQYVDWIRGRFGIELKPAAGFEAVHRLLRSQVEYRRLDALAVGQLDERFDVVLCFGMLHRVSDPVAILRTLAGVLEPGGELILETYGSALDDDTPAIEIHQPGAVYAGDEFVYWGFPPEGLRRLAGLAGLDSVEIVDQVAVDGHPRIVAVLRAGARARDR